MSRDKNKITCPGWTFAVNEQDTAFRAASDWGSIGHGSILAPTFGNTDLAVHVVAGSAREVVRAEASRIRKRYWAQLLLTGLIIMALLLFGVWKLSGDTGINTVLIAMLAIVAAVGATLVTRPHGLKCESFVITWIPKVNIGTELDCQLTAVDARRWDYTPEHRQQLLQLSGEAPLVQEHAIRRLTEHYAKEALRIDQLKDEAVKREDDAADARATEILDLP